jgi:hypothetical protein
MLDGKSFTEASYRTNVSLASFAARGASCLTCSSLQVSFFVSESVVSAKETLRFGLPLTFAGCQLLIICKHVRSEPGHVIVFAVLPMHPLKR